MNRNARSCGDHKFRHDASFGDDVRFLQEYTEVLILSDPSSEAELAVAPLLQARVMTSTADGREGSSYGWINRSLIAEGRRDAHMNAFGGEDRFWLGPEGGQFGIFFEKGAAFDFEHWQTPDPIDWGGWELSSRDARSATFFKDMTLLNRLGTAFHLKAERQIKMLSLDEIEAITEVKIEGGVRVVGFESENSIRNEGREEWRKETGLLSIWILGMYKPAPATVVVIPFRPGPSKELGEIVNDAYFGKPPSERLKISKSVIFFKCDGLFRSKIGISPARAKALIGSYDRDRGNLTLVKFDLPGSLDYVNSMWEEQAEPYRGDAVNSYNDGPPEPGKPPMGPFYELETSSPAAALAPGQSAKHLHRTFHFQGTERELDSVALATLGVGLDEINSAL